MRWSPRSSRGTSSCWRRSPTWGSPSGSRRVWPSAPPSRRASPSRRGFLPVLGGPCPPSARAAPAAASSAHGPLTRPARAVLSGPQENLAEINARTQAQQARALSQPARVPAPLDSNLLNPACPRVRAGGGRQPRPRHRRRRRRRHPEQHPPPRPGHPPDAPLPGARGGRPRRHPPRAEGRAAAHAEPGARGRGEDILCHTLPSTAPALWRAAALRSRRDSQQGLGTRGSRRPSHRRLLPPLRSGRR